MWIIALYFYLAENRFQLQRLINGGSHIPRANTMTGSYGKAAGISVKGQRKVSQLTSFQTRRRKPILT